MNRVKNYLRNILLSLLERLGMVVDLYTFQDGEWKFFQENEYKVLSRVGDNVDIYIDEQLKIYKVVDVIIRGGTSNPILYVTENTEIEPPTFNN